MREKMSESILSDEQSAAISQLAHSRNYSKQSKISVFRQLPAGQKWAYFRQNFLLGTVVVIVVALIISVFAVSVFTKGPECELCIATVNAQNYNEAFVDIKNGFVASANLADARIATVDTSFSLSRKAVQDDSARLLARVSSGQITVIAAEPKVFARLNANGYVTHPAEVMNRSQLKKYKAALVDKDGEPASDVNDAVGFDMAHSKIWRSHVPQSQSRMILGFSNVTKHKAMPLRFVEYLNFRG